MSAPCCNLNALTKGKNNISDLVGEQYLCQGDDAGPGFTSRIHGGDGSDPSSLGFDGGINCATGWSHGHSGASQASKRQGNSMTVSQIDDIMWNPQLVHSPKAGRLVMYVISPKSRRLVDVCDHPKVRVTSRCGQSEGTATSSGRREKLAINLASGRLK